MNDPRRTQLIRRISVTLDHELAEALVAASRRNLRPPRYEVERLVRDGLRREGLLPTPAGADQ